MKANKVFKDTDFFELKSNSLVCPLCGYENQHVVRQYVVGGGVDYSSGWWGRGDLYVIQFQSECMSMWELCFGEHKGAVASFIRILEVCAE